MPERMGHTEPFQSGQQTNARGKSDKVPVKHNMSKERNIGNPDPLQEAIRGRDSYIPGDLHGYGHSKVSKPGGAHYNPAGEYGKLKMGQEHKSRATGMGSHASGPGANPLGLNSNRQGQKSGYPAFKPRGGGRKP